MLRYVLLASLILSSSVVAKPFGDAEKGKLKSPSCVYCHGSNGITTNDAYPNLAGQNAQYLYDSMKAYQEGLRLGPLAEMMAAQRAERCCFSIICCRLFQSLRRISPKCRIVHPPDGHAS